MCSLARNCTLFLIVAISPDGTEGAETSAPENGCLYRDPAEMQRVACFLKRCSVVHLVHSSFYAVVAPYAVSTCREREAVRDSVLACAAESLRETHVVTWTPSPRASPNNRVVFPLRLCRSTELYPNAETQNHNRRKHRGEERRSQRDRQRESEGQRT